MHLIILLTLWIAIPFVAAEIAKGKGRSYGKTLVLGLILSPLVSLIVAFGLSPRPDAIKSTERLKICPKCAERIKHAALVCRFCGEEFQYQTNQSYSSSFRAVKDPVDEWEKSQKNKVKIQQKPVPIAPSIFISQGDKQDGPFVVVDVRARLSRGEIADSAFYWKEGMTEWRPISEL
jgi:hypothetical protein